MKAKTGSGMMRTMKVAAVALFMALSGCGGVELEEPQVSEAAAELETPAAESFVCTARNCVARCATCVFRRCLERGRAEEECEAERDFCIEECDQPQECQPGDPCDQP
jgi:hypothetical protein